MIKTVSLTAGTETKVEISGGYNVGVINRTTDMLYASRNSGIVAGADDVAAIPAGDSYTIRAADDTVYLLATAAGDVQLESLGAKEVFKIAATRTSSGGGEGGTVDEVARQAIASHANNEDIHLTAEKAIKAAATAISNKNYLINPNFKVNQRGQTEWTSVSFTADRWYMRSLADDFKVTLEDKGLRITNISGTETGGTVVWQRIPLSELDLRNCTVTVSAKISEITGVTGLRIIADGAAPAGVRVAEDGIHTVTYTVGEYTDYIGVGLTSMSVDCSALFEWVKFEVGSVATPFVPPDLAEEFAKCQRYYQVHTTGDIDPVDLRPTMRAITDIKERSDGNYEYNADF